jgi:hypothetical protein
MKNRMENVKFRNKMYNMKIHKFILLTEHFNSFVDFII